MSKLYEHPIKAIVFDNDGTLMDTEWVYSVAHKEVTGQELKWELKRQLMGRSPIEACRITVEQLGLDMTPEELLARRTVLVSEYWPTIPLMPGVDWFVKELKNRSIPMAVATASERNGFNLKCSGHLDLIALMDHTTTSDEVAAGKPSPDLFLKALSKWDGIKAENTLVFEDSALGILAANRAGMPAVYIPDSHVDPEEELKKVDAHAVQILKSMGDFDFDKFKWQ